MVNGIFASISFSGILLLVYRNTTDFCIMMYPTQLFITYAESDKMIQMNIFTKQKKTHKDRKLMVTKGERQGGGTNWEFGIDILLIYIIDKQQGPIVQHRELYSISYNNLQWKIIFKKYICIYDTESLFCSPETL